jgi:hypothetical protein
VVGVIALRGRFSWACPHHRGRASFAFESLAYEPVEYEGNETREVLQGNARASERRIRKIKADAEFQKESADGNLLGAPRCVNTRARFKNDYCNI